MLASLATGSSACQGAGCSNFLQVSAPTATTFSDTGLTGSTPYSYRVRATDAAGNLSAYSSIASASTPAPPDTTPPTAPTNLTATAASASQINLAWTASTDNVGVTGYMVERCQGAACSNFAQIATPTTTTFSDTALTASTSYSYRVRATDAAGNLSAYSNTASASTPAPPDNHPANSAHKLDGNGCFSIADKPGVDRFDRQRWRDRLSGRTLPGRELLEFRTNCRAHHINFQRHWPGRFHLLFLPRARHRRGEQPERLLQHSQHYHSCCAGHHPAHCAYKLDGNGCFSVADKPGVDRFYRQCWRDRLHGRTLHGRGMLELRASRHAHSHRLQ